MLVCNGALWNVIEVVLKLLNHKNISLHQIYHIFGTNILVPTNVSYIRTKTIYHILNNSFEYGCVTIAIR